MTAAKPDPGEPPASRELAPDPAMVAARRRPWRSWIAALFACVAVTVFVAQWVDRRPADLHRPLVWTTFPSGQALPPDDDALRIAAFNVHSCKGGDGITSVPRVADVLRGSAPDVTGLFEVRGGFWNGDQTSQIAGLLGGRAMFLATEHQYGSDHFGQGLIDGTNRAEVTRVPLPGTRGKAFRMVNWSRIPWQGETLNLLFVHIDSADDRARQLRDVLSLFDSVSTPAILLGDFNTRPDDAVLKAYVDRPDVTDLLDETSPVHGSERISRERIDGALARGNIHCVQADLVANQASDHPAVFLRLR